MNERFKFRVWDKKHNEYIPSNMISTLLYFGYKDEFHIEFECFSTFADSLIIEQCTGLKDKNSNLIYEGDVVICDRDFQEGRVGLERVVVFSDTAFHLQRKDGTDRYYMDMFHNFEIIGNIHEQKEEQ